MAEQLGVCSTGVLSVQTQNSNFDVLTERKEEKMPEQSDCPKCSGLQMLQPENAGIKFKLGLLLLACTDGFEPALSLSFLDHTKHLVVLAYAH